MKFSVSGKIKTGGKNRTFVKELEAKSENDAKEKTYALFGSNNRLRRTMILIEKVEKEG